MRSFKLLILLVALLFTKHQSVFSSEQLLSEQQNINISSGLSHNVITKIFCDSRGIMWFGTYDGLNMYNGVSIYTYKDTYDYINLPSNRIRDIIEDIDTRLWIGTEQGVEVYDYHSDKFSLLPVKDVEMVGYNLVILKIIPSEDGQRYYCITSNNGIITYDRDLRFVRQTPLSLQIIDALSLNDNIILISTTSGFHLYDITRNVIEAVDVDADVKFNNSHLPIRLANYNDSTILVGINNRCIPINYIKSDKGYIFTSTAPINFDFGIKDIVVDDKGAIWLASERDGFFYMPSISSRSSEMKNYLSNHQIAEIMPFNDGDLWVGSSNNGAYKFVNNTTAFMGLYDIQIFRPQVFFVGQNMMLVKSNSINLYDISSKASKIKQVFDLPNATSSESKLMLQDGESNFFIITKDFLYYASLHSDKINVIADLRNYGLPSRAPQFAEIDSDRNLWLGYEDDLCKITLGKRNNIQQVESIKQHKLFSGNSVSRIKALYYDKFTNSVWAGSNVMGLYKIELSPSKPIQDLNIEHYLYKESDSTSLPSNFISSIIRTPDNTLWVGTGQKGFCRAEENGDEISFKTYNQSNGLSHNVIKSMQYDLQGNLWIATNIGLNMFNPANEQFRVYDSKDGLPFDGFWIPSANSSDGKVAFTNLNGFCYFDPSKLAHEDIAPKVSFHNLKIHNQKVIPQQEFNGRVIIDNRPQHNDNIVLKYNENVFSVDVCALFASESSSNYIYYKLEPANSEWTRINAVNSVISFSALSSGSYSLYVKAANNAGYISEPQVLNIRVQPPLWKSTFAYILYVVLLIVVIAVVLVVFSRFQSLHYSLQLKEMEKENIKRLNEDKQRYFSNISHELKTPLTLIIAPLSILVERFKLDVQVKENLIIIQRQAKKMLRLIDLAHSVELRNDDLLKLSLSTFLFRDLIKGIAVDFDFLAGYANKKFIVEYPQKALRVSADHTMLENVLNNLINNAFKHTDEGDQIVVSYQCNKHILTVRVSDTGHGIAKEDLCNVFDRFFVSKKNLSYNVGGTGIGLSYSKSIIELHSGTITVDSVDGEGTTFTINLPILLEEVEVVSEANVLQDSSEMDLVIDSLDMSSVNVDSDLKSSMVYIVEDNDEMRTFISNTVGLFFKVKSFSNPVECLKDMEEEWPDIIVSDIMMPMMSGDEFCAKVKGDLRTSHIPIILLTALQSIDDKLKGIELGADSYISKPFYPKHLIVRLDALLRNRQQLKERYRTNIPTRNEKPQANLSKDSKFIEDLYGFFRNNLDAEDIDFKQVALRFGFNRTTFYAKVKALTNTSPYELLKDYRMQCAVDLLESGEYTISEISSMVGIKDRSHFSRLFKAKYGVAPTNYIKKGL